MSKMRENFPNRNPSEKEKIRAKSLECPPVPEALLLYLEKSFPVEVADPARFPDARTIYFSAGRSALVQLLRATYEVQNATPNGYE
jgi:hypothetical protein